MRSRRLGARDVDLLMELQYSFPLARRPFAELGGRLGMGEDGVLAAVSRLAGMGVVTRIGLSLCRWLLGREASALVALSVEEGRVEEAARRVNSTPGVGHNYLRSHDRFNVWFTLAGGSVGEVARAARGLAEELGVRDYLILPTRRVYKLDVKLDLRRGVSWSPPHVLPDRGKAGRLAHALELLEALQRLPLSPTPFDGAARSLGIPAEALLRVVEEAVRSGVSPGVHAFLDPHAAGFAANAMIAIEAERPGEACKAIASGIPEVTHCVEREVLAGKDWPYRAYAVVHARDRRAIEEVVGRIAAVPGVRRVEAIYSVRRLR